MEKLLSNVLRRFTSWRESHDISPIWYVSYLRVDEFHKNDLFHHQLSGMFLWCEIIISDFGLGRCRNILHFSLTQGICRESETFAFSIFQHFSSHHRRNILLLVSIWLTISHEIKHTLSKEGFHLLRISTIRSSCFENETIECSRVYNKMLKEAEDEMMKLNEGSFEFYVFHIKRQDEGFWEFDHLIAVGIFFKFLGRSISRLNKNFHHFFSENLFFASLFLPPSCCVVPSALEEI